MKVKKIIHWVVSFLLIAGIPLVFLPVRWKSSLAQDNPPTGAGPLLSAHQIPALEPDEVIARVAPSVVLILVGEGGGRLAAVGSGLIVRSDGVVFTAYHLVRNAREAQVRLKNGETYDRIELLAADERRDVAALRVPAAGLPVLPVADADQIQPGQAVYVVSNPGGLAWSASSGILSAWRAADEVTGAGTGYRLMQFTAPVSPGSSGGALVDARGHALGLVVGTKQGQSLNFAVPIESVMGLAGGDGGRYLAEGKDLELPQPQRPPQAAAVAKADPQEMVKTIRTFCVQGNPEFPAEPLEKKLFEKEEFRSGQFLIVRDPRAADVVIELERKPFTWDFTYRMTHRSSGVILGAGKVIAWDGVRAAPGTATQIVKRLRELRPADVARKKKS